jgi:hypothetical protein
MSRNAAAGMAGHGQGPLLRLDPSLLPLRFHAPLAGTTDEAPAHIALDRDGVSIRGARSGLPFDRSVPMADYRGVAVRMVPADGGELRIMIELLHADPALSLPLAVATTPGDIVADWQAWAKALRRPLLLVGDDGAIVEPTPRLGRLEIGAIKPRRLHSFFAARRPRFLTRRKTGRPTSERIAGREIIARD